MRTIAQIDKDITAVHKHLRRLEKINTMPAASWQKAWDKHPKLRAKETKLYRERGEAQQVRDAKAAKEAVRVARIDNAKQRKESAAKFKAEKALEAAAPKMLAVLRLISKGFHTGKMPDQTILDTDRDGPELKTHALSFIVDEAIAKAEGH